MKNVRLTEIAVSSLEVRRIISMGIPTVKDYIGSNAEEKKYMEEKFRGRFSVTCTLSKRLKSDLQRLNEELWETKLIGQSRPRKQTDLKILNYLNILATGNSSERKGKKK